ncbi:alpha/beta hydrolase family protein [Acinetobacter variabilis]|uniref:alpha/beta hydrolase family protein n=1 Tax=Acinetobacter variabilis TaxID=70346 RepID=UPI000ED7AA2F|nr:prolyl oligopeptidase family serine peptidase [Acinetobacter variabilis]HCL60217.1 alpha/beta hydrolase [Acinetobacter sp.]MBO3660199.1 alpha/beta hydrolase [Acinetobacter variabilis]MCU4363783.1 alpha/beta hydrolase [Acinetobacter variabilis]MCU4373839.1 alpha/beta hydrolase [Acinetobacter variabilis]UXI50535.1 alpha/beta hydrolase [Acinetobacter variabilis]
MNNVVKNGFKKTCLALVCSMSLFMTACNDDDNDSFRPQERVFLSQQSYDEDTLPEASDIQVIRYNMPNVNGERAEATAMVFYPNTPQPQDGWRVVVWEHGTVGSGDSCAPSNNQLNNNFRGLASSLLAQGYVIVAPDYEGLGTRGIHPYLNLKSAAQSAIYAVRAFKEQQGNRFNGAWVSVGQSQGGHASLATAQFADEDPNYKAAVAAAPASSLGYIISEVAPQALSALVEAGQDNAAKAVYAELLAYAAYVAVGIKAYEPGFNYRNIFSSRAGIVAEKAEGTTGENGLCLGPLITEYVQDIDDYLVNNPEKTVVDYPGLVENFQNNSSVEKFLENNQPATEKINVPVMIIQGTADMAVPYPVTNTLQQGLKDMGTTVTFVPVQDASHTEAIVQSRTQLLTFINTYMPSGISVSP